METTILIQSAPKPNAINPPTQLWFTLNLIKIGLLASEIFFFEIVDGRTTDACFGSGELKMNKFHSLVICGVIEASVCEYVQFLSIMEAQ